MNPGDTASYTIYAIPHKDSNPVSIATFHTREKTSLKIPYRVLQPGLEWMPNDGVTAYDSNVTDTGFTISAFGEAGTHHLQMYLPGKDPVGLNGQGNNIVLPGSRRDNHSRLGASGGDRGKNIP